MELVNKNQQFNGFRQEWTERPDGVFHGPYTVFWESDQNPCMRGQYKDGAQDGIWTYWDRSGAVERQVRFVDDEEAETRVASPWFGEVE